MDEVLKWLRDRLAVDGHPEVTDALLDFLDLAMMECDYAGTTESLLESEAALRAAVDKAIHTPSAVEGASHE